MSVIGENRPSQLITPVVVRSAGDGLDGGDGAVGDGQHGDDGGDTEAAARCERGDDQADPAEEQGEQRDGDQALREALRSGRAKSILASSAPMYRMTSGAAVSRNRATAIAPYLAEHVVDALDGREKYSGTS